MLFYPRVEPENKEQKLRQINQFSLRKPDQLFPWSESLLITYF